MINDFPTWPQLHANDLLAVRRVLESNRLSQISSKAVPEFEESFAALHGRKHCVAVSSGTAAIHLALAALGVGRGNEVIVPSHTFIGSASPVLALGATPLFADIDDASYCILPESVERLITPSTRAVIAVHLNGHPAPLTALAGIAGRHGISVIEDVAQAVGGRFNGERLGAIGEFSCFSFWEDKIITMGGEGGAILTDNDAAAVRMRSLRQHGEQFSSQTGLYSSGELGYNYRLTAMQAALGLSQLARLDAYVECRRSNARRLSRGLQQVAALRLPEELAGCTHAYWKYVCQVRQGALSISTPALVTALQAAGVPAFRRYPVPLHRQPVFAKGDALNQACPTTDGLTEFLFSLPVHPAMSDVDIDRLAERVCSVVGSVTI